MGAAEELEAMAEGHELEPFESGPVNPYAIMADSPAATSFPLPIGCRHLADCG